MDRYGIPPELIPDFYGLKGDTSDNIPGVPGIGDKTAAQLLQRFGDLETVLASVDEISGAKRKENLVNHAEDARVSKRLATSIRDVPVELDLDGSLVREPDRSRLRETFREFELRDPLRRLEEALGERGRGRARGSSPRRASRHGRARRSAIRAGGRSRASWPRWPPTAPSRTRTSCRAWGRSSRCASPPTPAATRCWWARRRAAWPSCWAAGATRPVVAHDCKALACRPRTPVRVAPPLEHDTVVAAYLMDPARRGYPLAELVEELGLGAEVEGGDDAGRAAVLTRALAERQRARAGGAGAHAPAGRGRAAAGGRARGDGARRGEARRGHGAGRSPRGSAPRPQSSSARSGSSRARSSRSAPRSSSGPILFERARAVEEAPRQDRLLDRRPRAPGHPLTSTRSCRRSRPGAS